MKLAFVTNLVSLCFLFLVADVEAQQGSRVAEVTAALTAKGKELADLEGQQWTAGHVAAVVARAHLYDAARNAAAGSISAAEKALGKAEAALRIELGQAKLRTTDGVVAGLVAGHPYLGNDKVAYVWSRVEDGAGLLSVYNRRTVREFLKIAPTASSLWRIQVKKGEEEKSYSNVGSPCTVTRQPRGLVFAWQGEMDVRLLATLNPDETVLRVRLNARPRQADEGLRTVVFPVVSGIGPLTPDGAGDTIFDTWRGWTRASPLVSGKPFKSDYPRGMQFSAMIAEGQGLYFAEEDPEACRKDLTWSPQKQTGTLNFTITHPVLGWAGLELIKDYASPGDVVIGPFQGDWYDAARLYRKWALTAPWCAKGPIYKRTDYPQWLAEAPYWTFAHLGEEPGIENEIDHVETFGLPVGVCHAYSWWFQPHQDDGYPDYFPPRLGSEGLKRSVQRLHRSGMRVVPYVNGLLWDEDTESWRADNAVKGAIKPRTTMEWGGNRHALMCPGSALWRDKNTEVCKELVGRYGMDGIYFDFLTTLGAEDYIGNCRDPGHGHPLGGGDYWAKTVRGFLGQIRREIKQLNPDVMLTGEEWAEYTIDVLDTQLTYGHIVPLFEAVYHGYTLFYGGRGTMEPYDAGRFWLYGNQNGWYRWEGQVVQALKGNPDYQKWLPHAQYYVNLLHCHYYFGRPYLAYGEMLRPPRIEGDLPPIVDDTECSPYDPVEGSIWKAPDGSVGVFLLNYDTVRAHEFSWTVDLREGAGWDSKTKVVLSKWTKKEGLVRLAEVAGGKLSRNETIEPWGLIALKLEAMK